VVVERPRSPSPPVLVDPKSEKNEYISHTCDNGTEKTLTGQAKRVKFADQNSVRLFEEESRSSMQNEGEEISDAISKSEAAKEERHFPWWVLRRISLLTQSREADSTRT
jgi:hypothetical protein